MLIAMPNWPPFAPTEYARDIPAELLELLPLLHGSCIVVQTAVYDHALIAYMKSSSEFNRKIRKSLLAPVINQVEISITRSLVLSVASLLDKDPAAINIRRLLTVAVQDRWLPVVSSRHQLRGDDVLQKQKHLIRMQRRLNREPLKSAIERVTQFRNKGVAHVDKDHSLEFRIPTYGDIAMTLAAEANIVVSLLSYLTFRRAEVRALYKQAKQQAELLGRAIQLPTT